MSTFVMANDKVMARVNMLKETYYPDLIEAKVTILVLMAFAPTDDEGQPKGAAIKHHGIAAAGLIKINSTKDRVAGKADCDMTLDGDEWDGWSEQRKLAVIHHELEHVIVLREKNGAVKFDEHLRPKIKLKQHDVDLGGFASIAKIYEDDAFEVELTKFAMKQLLMPWG